MRGRTRPSGTWRRVSRRPPGAIERQSTVGREQDPSRRGDAAPRMRSDRGDQRGARPGSVVRSRPSRPSRPTDRRRRPSGRRSRGPAGRVRRHRRTAAGQPSSRQRPSSRSSTSTATMGQGRPPHAPWRTSRPPARPTSRSPGTDRRSGRTAPSARSMTRVRQAIAPHDWTARRSARRGPRRIRWTRSDRTGRPAASRIEEARHRRAAATGRRQTPRSARVRRSTRNSMTARRSGVSVARRMHRRPVAASAGAATRRGRRATTSIAGHRRTPRGRRPPNGPAAKDSAGQVQAPAGSPVPRPDRRGASRWPLRRQPSGERIQAPTPGPRAPAVSGAAAIPAAAAGQRRWIPDPVRRAPGRVAIADDGAQTPTIARTDPTHPSSTPPWSDDLLRRCVVAGGGRGGHRSRRRLHRALIWPGGRWVGEVLVLHSRPTSVNAAWSRSRCDSGTVPLR